jgi:hypothetical protein
MRLMERFGAATRSRRATSGAWCAPSRRRSTSTRADPGGGLHRVVGTSGTILGLGAMAARGEAARAGRLRNLRVPARGLTACGSGSSAQPRAAAPPARAGPAPRRPAVAGAVLLDTILRRLDAADLTLCDLALREGLVLDYIHRNTRTSRRWIAIPTSGAAASWRAGRALQLLGGARRSRCAARAVALRPDARAARARRPGARVAGVRGAAARPRRAHQLRGAPPPLLLPREARRPAGLRAGRDRVVALVARYHRRATPQEGHASSARCPRATQDRARALAALLPWPRASTAATRSRSPGATARPRRRRAARAARVGRRRARALGRRPTRRAVRAARRQAGPFRSPWSHPAC